MGIQPSVFQMRTHLFNYKYYLGNNFFGLLNLSKLNFERIVFEYFLT